MTPIDLSPADQSTCKANMERLLSDCKPHIAEASAPAGHRCIIRSPSKGSGVSSNDLPVCAAPFSPQGQPSVTNADDLVGGSLRGAAPISVRDLPEHEFEQRMIERDRLRAVINSLNRPGAGTETQAALEDFRRRHSNGGVKPNPSTRPLRAAPYSFPGARRRRKPSAFSCADQYGTRAYQFGGR